MTQAESRVANAQLHDENAAALRRINNYAIAAAILAATRVQIFNPDTTVGRGQPSQRTTP